MTSILAALTDRHEAEFVRSLEAAPDLELVRRCADVAELLSAGAAGAARVAVVSPDLRGLDRDALRHLAGVLLHRPSERARILAARGDLAEFEAGLVSVFGLDAMADTGATVSMLPPTLHETDAATTDAADTAVG